MAQHRPRYLLASALLAYAGLCGMTFLQGAPVSARGSRLAMRAEGEDAALAKPVGTSKWVNTQSPGMSHPSGYYALPYVPEKKAEEYDYTTMGPSKKVVTKARKNAAPVWDISNNYVGDFN